MKKLLMDIWEGVNRVLSVIYQLLVAIVVLIATVDFIVWDKQPENATLAILIIWVMNKQMEKK